MAEALTDREKIILQSIIHYFILTANPVGSRFLSKRNPLRLSPATIRNIMADMEEKGYIDQPHTSAGRVPTTKGYRFYVDQLIKKEQIPPEQQEVILENISTFDGDVDFLLEKTAHVLAQISNQLGVIISPKFYEGTLEKIELISVSSAKMLVVISVRSGLVKTIMLEIPSEIPPKKLHYLNQILNERLYGLSLKEIKNTFYKRLADLRREEPQLIRIFFDSAEKLFDFTRYEEVRLTGTSNILHQPEFADIKKFSSLIELLEEKNIIIHLLEKQAFKSGTKIVIGEEHPVKEMQNCSVVTSTYQVGDVNGVLGVIGPTRMAYERVIPLVEYTARVITQVLSRS